MNLKAQYNAFMVKHPLLRGGVWLIAKLFMLTMVAVLFVLEVLFRAFGNASKEQAESDEQDVNCLDGMAKDMGYEDYEHMRRLRNYDYD